MSVVGKVLFPSEAEQARAVIEQLGIGDRVRFEGWIPAEQLRGMWLDHHVYVQPSLQERHGSALDEALSTGIPILASDLPVFRERLDGTEVRFVPPGDEVGMTRVLQDLRPQRERRRLSDAALARSATFPDFEETMRGYERVIRDELVRETER